MAKDFLKDHAKQVIASHQADERLSIINDKALAGAAIIAIVFDVAMMIYFIIRKEVFAAIPFIIQMVAMGTFVSYYKMKKKDYQIPVTLTGRAISTAMDKRGKLHRIGYYMAESAMFVAVFIALDYFLSERESVKQYVITASVLFVILFLFNYFAVERRVKKYNKYLDGIEE